MIGYKNKDTEELIRNEWRDATTDPPTESGRYMVAMFWKSTGHWYITDWNYSAKWGYWNCNDTTDEEWARSRALMRVDYWMPMLPTPDGKEAVS